MTIEREPMSVDLAGKTAFVTGGNAGIGRAISVALAQAGASVVATAYSSAANPFDAADGDISCVHLDATDSAAVESVMAGAASSLGGKIDILVNNAGGLLARVPVADMSDEHFHSVMDVNFTTGFYCTRAVLAHMPDGGTIVNLASLAAQDGGGNGSSIYSASKAATIGFTRAMAKELAPRQIRVNAIAPGYIADTPFHDAFTPVETQQAIAGKTPLGRGGRPEEVAESVVYLASPMSSFVTGATIAINGGLYFA